MRVVFNSVYSSVTRRIFGAAFGTAKAAPVVNALLVVVGVTAAVGVVMRFVAPSPLWLDEALTVNIALLPLDDMVSALRHDGHPPLYYALLGLWMDVFGESDAAVRALSGVCSLAVVPFIWALTRRRFGPRVASFSAVLAVTSPFLIRYGTEARMYALAALLVVLGWWLADLCLEQPKMTRQTALAVTVAAGLYTHYWMIWLVVTSTAVLAVRWLRQPQQRTSTTAVLSAVIIGGLTFVAWLPILITQAAHTGTPWAKWARPAEVVIETIQGIGGGMRYEPMLLGMLLAAAIVVGATTQQHPADSATGPRNAVNTDRDDALDTERGVINTQQSDTLDTDRNAANTDRGGALDTEQSAFNTEQSDAWDTDRSAINTQGSGALELGWPPRHRSAALVAVAVGTLSLGGLVALIVGSAFEARYIAVVVGLLLALAGRGVAVLTPRKPSGALATLALLAVFGVVVAVDDARRDRSQGEEIAQVITANVTKEIIEATGETTITEPGQQGGEEARHSDGEEVGQHTGEEVRHSDGEELGQHTGTESRNPGDGETGQQDGTEVRYSGDVVVACPDQIAPALARYLDLPLPVLTFPPTDTPTRVDWYDYRERIQQAEPAAVAATANEIAGSGTVWLVSAPGYYGFGQRCSELAAELSRDRAAQNLVAARPVYEPMWLRSYATQDTTATAAIQ